MKYIFTIYLFGEPVRSHPVDRAELDKLIEVHLDNNCPYFEVAVAKEA